MHVKAEYVLNIHDFRRATYYGLFVRYILALRIMVLVVAGSVAYAVAGYLGFISVSPLIFFIAVAYLVWAALIFGKAERNMRSYMKSRQSLLGCAYEIELTKTRIRLRIPERDLDVAFSVSELYCVFEISSLFLIYVSAEQVYIVPKRAFSDEDAEAIRKNFSAKLDKRFRTRFGETRKKDSRFRGLWDRKQ